MPLSVIEREPLSLRRLTDRLLRHPESRVLDYPSKGGPRTYRDLHHRVQVLRQRLESRGFAPGMRVGIWMKNSCEWLAIDLALLELRCVSVPLPDDVAG